MSRMGWERPEDWEEQEQFESETGLRGRLYFFRLVIVVIIGLLLFRVIWLQQTQGEELTAAAGDNQFATLQSDAPRGVIFDRTGLPLAENIPSFNVTITPAFLPDDDAARQAIFERLSFLTGVPVTNTVQQRELARQANPYNTAVNRQLATLYNEPITKTLDLAGVVPQLPDSINTIVDRFSFAENLPAEIVANVPYTIAQVIEQESVYMPGVRVIPEPIRNYPSGELTSHIVGFMGPLPDESYLDQGYARDDRVGLFGVESSLETFLKGVKGQREVEVDWRGREVRQIGVETPPQAGYNLHLSIDMALQQAAFEILQAQMERREATRDSRTGEFVEVQSGAVVALNAKTGEVLSMVSLPTFDNNRFATEIPVEYYLGLARSDYQPLFNHAIGGQYPPGSVFKVVTGAAALQEGIVSPNRFLDTPGSIVIPNRFAPNDPGRAQQFVCWIWNTIDPETGQRGEHGSMNMYRALAESCDIYFYKVAGGFDQDGEVVDVLGIDRLSRYANQFGMGRVQGVELPAEAPGNIPTQAYKRTNFGEPWSTGDDYNSAIGQGFVTATPLQIAQMVAVIANGGFLYRPTVVNHMTNDKGEVVLFDEANPDRPIFASPDENNNPVLRDADGNIIDPEDVNISVSFDENGEYIYQPEVLNVLEVDREYLDVIAEGMFLVNQEGGTGGFMTWLDEWGITTAGKTGTAEFCDNIALKRDWCKGPGEIQPTHAWYVGYAPYDDPEIVVAAFLYHGGEGSEWAAPVVRDVMKAYFQVDQYAPVEPTPEDSSEPVIIPEFVEPATDESTSETTTP
ncbi:MAG: penicillin-binding protein 2 [Anaerolineae bacterium]|nr:penicillin-binding protein 2 [Anaerolineae bacterium]MCO5192726.1 penicillin-binding protein 2 [Anaerolineae bacterium]MCO5199828.1 penicillin-binding protein 2 [Anaerolineae bacterium]MCO5207296.1 penicillin-binding protein 2 [Anaerolineae bacterium]